MQQLQNASDSILYFANLDTYNRDKRRKQAFSMLVRSHTLAGDSKATQAFSDSLVAIYKSEAYEHTSQYIANAHQYILNSTIEQVEKKVADYRNKLIYILIIFVVLTLSLTYIISLYRRLQAILKKLVEKNIKLAHENENYNKTEIEDNTPDVEPISKEDTAVMLRVKRYIIQEKNYRNANLSLTDVSAALEVNRTYLSRAINQTTGDSFKAYINQLRIYEAIKMMNTQKGISISLDTIAQKVGFSGRTTFFTNFKRVTGLNPSEFKQNLR